MQRLEVSGAVRLIYRLLGVKGLRVTKFRTDMKQATKLDSYFSQTCLWIAVFRIGVATDVGQLHNQRLYQSSSRIPVIGTILSSSSNVCLHHEVLSLNPCRLMRLYFNRLTPNDPYMCRTAQLTFKHCILYIYSTNIGTEYFKHALYSPFFLFKMQFVS